MRGLFISDDNTGKQVTLTASQFDLHAFGFQQ